MKIRVNSVVNYSDVNENYQLALSGILRRLQDVSAYHSEHIRHGIRDLHSQNMHWVLGKLQVSVSRFPEYGESLELVSWSRGPDRFRMLRDYIILVGDEEVALGSSIWFFVDLNSRKIVRTPTEIVEAYQSEEQQVFSSDLRQWNQYNIVEPEFKHVMQLRASDLAAAGHINNAQYGDYITDALSKWGAYTKPIKTFRIQYNREISSQVQELTVGFLVKEELLLFSLSTEETVFAVGEIEF